jgi:hypothetical protein
VWPAKPPPRRGRAACQLDTLSGDPRFPSPTRSLTGTRALRSDTRWGAVRIRHLLLPEEAEDGIALMVMLERHWLARAAAGRRPDSSGGGGRSTSSRQPFPSPPPRSARASAHQNRLLTVAHPINLLIEPTDKLGQHAE